MEGSAGGQHCQAVPGEVEGAATLEDEADEL
jgi:hypothetical protein